MDSNPHRKIDERGNTMILSKQKGFTLVEMLIALMIAGIFFSVFVGVVLATFETLRSGDERTVAQQNARVAINYITNDIRHATEIAPLRMEAYRDYATGGFPIADDTIDPFDPGFTTEAWPIYRRSVDSDPDGYIDLDLSGGIDGDEYEYFREDDFPYDVRAISPNRLSLLFYGSNYYSNTEYWAGLGLPIDLDDNGLPNPTAAPTRVTYEHQLIEPLHPEIYEGSFSGRTKNFQMVVNRTDADAVSDSSDFVVYRTFEILNPTLGIPNTGLTDEPADGPLGGVNDQIRMDEPYLRQPVADHVVNIRYRYWHIDGNRMLEIRYDPDPDGDNIGGGGITPDDGYYRYFDIFGQEYFVWYNHDTGEIVPLLPTDYDDNDEDNIPPHSFYINGGVDGDDEYERGILLFEGWRFINAISITVKTANNQTLDIFRSSINQAVTNPAFGSYDFTHPDYGMGFVDFGLGGETTDTTNTINAVEPLFQGADNLRISTAPVNGVDVFDFVEPNMNPNYNASAFTTIQTFVSPPALKESADQALRMLRFGLRCKCGY